MSEYTDWSTRTATAGLAVMLPGRGYTCQMPLLNFAAQVADSHGWLVREVGWEPSEEWGTQEVGCELAEAIGDHEGPVRVIGKSLGTLAAPYAAECRLDAVWLTPLLTLPPVAEAIDAHPGRQLLVGGTGDVGFWDSGIAAALSAEVLEIPGADHGLRVKDPVRTAEIHIEVVRALDRWFAEG
ncbi:hypothetical protein [Brachybacterium sacelli]|uniref:Alpha/beta hydrolase n=1 Tax=Brachybacterium sacelli TaxID=173364 RepID=A0ABS4X4Q8_9MICO|nr:hypothetical protein [Brachybacterium sacelli]MBP2383321.1 hypothetical protein [Brachybacterium sacelli]